ncbi:alcohol dehydrogenase-like protein Bli-4 [Sordaria brevicollis]|uniref:Alcohol dehydrogenase-like protein Bli-4 n=1 Tax=Sordaria brevicollis TaxID=83679 RepID=A0AAE0UAR1_SORBR|nr:alcohol dehydrogenase-like protein Bli-4 [Sordaria brevicollis]
MSTTKLSQRLARTAILSPTSLASRTSRLAPIASTARPSSSSTIPTRRPFSTSQARYLAKIPSMDKIRDSIASNFGGPASTIGTTSFSLDDTPDLSGKVAVITGGSEGIGFGVAFTLLKHNLSKLYILSRKQATFDGALDSIRTELGPAVAERVKWIHCDLEDWAEVAKVAEQIKRDTDRLDILVNNSGRGIMKPALTSYGVDRHMATNHFGHVILTSHLLPLMKKTAEEKGETVRISNQSSNLHSAAPGNTRFESLEEINEDVGPNGQYGRSKLAGILYGRYFDREVTGRMGKGKGKVVMNATHPGFVSTKQSVEDIHEPYPISGYAMSHLMEPFKKSQFEGAVPTVWAVTMANEGGQWICAPCKPEAGSELAQSDELADRLMELTRKIVTEKTRNESVGRGCPMDDVVVRA